MKNEKEIHEEMIEVEKERSEAIIKKDWAKVIKLEGYIDGLKCALDTLL